jgi:hypothetical protein
VGLLYTPATGQTCLRATIDVVVDSTGRPLPETARLVRATDPGFGVAVLSNLGGMRFEPARKDGRPVAQLVRFDQAIMAVVVPAGTPRSAVRPPHRPPC